MGLPASALHAAQPPPYPPLQSPGDVWADVLSGRATAPCPYASHTLANMMLVLGNRGDAVWRDQSSCAEIKLTACQLWRRDTARKRQKKCTQKHTHSPAHLLSSSVGCLWGLRSCCQMAQGLLICRRLRPCMWAPRSNTHTHTHI